jgi:hypothetical protein
MIVYFFLLGRLYIMNFKLITLFMIHEVWILSLLIIYNSCTVEVPWLKKWEAFTTLYPHYRGYNSLIDTSLTDNGVDLPVVDWSDSRSLNGFCSVRLWRKYDSCRSGDGKEAEWLLSMRTMDAMVGLSDGSSCTDSTPIWRHLMTWSLEEEFSKFGSNTCKGVPSAQCFQACNICTNNDVNLH